MRFERSARRNFTAQVEKLEVRAVRAADFYLSTADIPAEVAVVDNATTAPPLTTLGNTGYGWSDVSYVQSAYGLTGAGQTVAVIDTGVAWDQYALGGGFGAGHHVVGGWDFAENDADPFDDAPAGYHGTHVAGIIGSTDASNIGLAPNADIVALRVFNDQGQGYFSWVELALRWVHKNKDNFANPITTVNLSMGAEWNSSSVPSWATMEDELAQLKADGITVCVAAGNSFATYYSAGVGYPAASPSVIPVASVNQSGSLSYFSQRDQRVLAAPGEFVRSTAPDAISNNDGVKNDWRVASGTSMATPFVSGASVLVRQAMQRFGYTNITQESVYNQLYNTADIVYDSTTGANYHRINLKRAVDSLAGADDYGNTATTAYALGNWQGARTVSGRVQTVGDQDYFRFTAAQSGTLALNLQGAAGQTVTWAAAAGGTVSGNKLTLQVVAGNSYTVGVGASGIGNYQFSGTLAGSTNNVTATNWGAIDFRQVNNVVAAGEQWYSVTATRTGVLTAEAFFQNQRGNVDLEFYSSTQQSLGSSRGLGDGERLDVNVTAGTQYLLKVSGTNQSVNFRLTNLVSQSGSVVDVYGTSGADTVVWNGVAASSFVLNGVSYNNLTGVSGLNFHLAGGSDSVTLLGSSAAETTTLRPNSVTVTGGAVAISADSAEAIRLFGQSADQLKIYDSAGDDRLDASATSAMMRGEGYLNYAEGITTVDAYASTGNDVAKLYDSAGNDTFEGRPTQATLKGPGVNLSASNFDSVIALGGRGGTDVARFYDSSGNESFTAGPSSATMQGPGYYLSAERFADVRAYATAGGTDQATLNGNSQSSYTVSGSTKQLTGTGFSIQVDGFESIRTSGLSAASEAVFQALGNETPAGNSLAAEAEPAIELAEVLLQPDREPNSLSRTADELFEQEFNWV